MLPFCLSIWSATSRLTIVEMEGNHEARYHLAENLLGPYVKFILRFGSFLGV